MNLIATNIFAWYLLGLLLIITSNICSAEIYDVLVVGGGLSGLTTSYRLAQGGLNVILCDGDDSLGGRTRSATYLGNSVSIGGTWALFENTFTLQLANEVNALPIVPPLVPKRLDIFNIATNPYLLFKLWLIGYNMSFARDDYWNSNGAYQLDHMSLEQWLEQEQQTYFWPAEALQAVRDYLYMIETFPPILSNISTLHSAVMIYKRLRTLSAEGLYAKGLFRWEGGTGTFVEAIAKAFRSIGGTILHNSQVITIDYANNDQIVVKLSRNQTKIAKKVVIATSLPSSAYLTFNPPLPTNPNYMNLFRSITPADSASVQIVVTWSAKWYLLQGDTILPAPTQSSSCSVYGPVFDVTPGDSTNGILRILALDSELSYDCIVRGATTNAERNARITEYAKNWFKSNYVLNGTSMTASEIDSFFIETNVWDWRTRKSLLPGIVYYFPPNGSLVAYGDALRKTVNNRIYWAGSERAVNGLHWMEGAIQRGNDVACEVLADMGLVPNCTVYSNWLEYLVLLAFNTTNYQNLFSLYGTNLQILNQYACETVTQGGYICLSPKQPWRKPISALENQTLTLINAALTQLEIISNVINSAASLIGEKFGLNFPKKISLL